MSDDEHYGGRGGGGGDYYDEDGMMPDILEDEDELMMMEQQQQREADEVAAGEIEANRGDGGRHGFQTHGRLSCILLSYPSYFCRSTSRIK